MTMDQPPPYEVFSNRIFSWAFETRIFGIVNEDSINEAVMQYRSGGGGMVWLLDASGMTKFSFDAISAIKDHVIELGPMGLDRLALILPPEDMQNIPAIQEMMKEVMPIHAFETREDAVAWMRRRCR